MLDASTTAALVKAVEDYRTATGAILLTVGHGRTLLDRRCDRTVHWDTVARPGAPTAKASQRTSLHSRDGWSRWTLRPVLLRAFASASRTRSNSSEVRGRTRLGSASHSRPPGSGRS